MTSIKTKVSSIKKSLQVNEGFLSYFLLGNIKNENKSDIELAIIQERIQKNKKLDLSAQFTLAKTNVIKKVVVRFLRTFATHF